MTIKSIQKGSGQYAVWYRVGDKHSAIKEELKAIRFGKDAQYEIVVYRVYDHDRNMVAEIESNSSLLITYKS